MSDDDRDTLRKVAWPEVCPWLVIFRTFRLAIGLRLLVLGAVAIFLTLCGWAAMGWVFLEDQETVEWEMPAWMGPGQGRPWLAIDEAVPSRPTLRGVGSQLQGEPFPPAPWQTLDPYFGAWAQLSQPLWELGRGALTWPKLASLLLCGLWAVAVWAFFGGAITRIAAVELACEERVGWGAAVRHAGSKWLSYCAAPLLPLAGAAFCGAVFVVLPVVLLVFLPHWLLNTNVGVFPAALLWPLFLAVGWVMALLLLGLVFGWPLMWSTISSEGTDSFDALSRSYAYVFGRPLHYLFYALVAAVLGALGWLLVSNFAAGVVWLTYWAASRGAGSEEIQAIIDGSQTLGAVGGAGAWLIRLWAGCVKLLAVGFIYGYFWTASTAVYFLLRRDVDATEMDEVFLEEDTSEPGYGLPPLKTDEAGAPVVSEDVPEVEPDDLTQPEEKAEEAEDAGDEQQSGQ
jgi:hypothetical protein